MIMKRFIPNESLRSLLVICGIAGLNAASNAADTAAKVRWKATGELEEACSCRAA